MSSQLILGLAVAVAFIGCAISVGSLISELRSPRKTDHTRRRVSQIAIADTVAINCQFADGSILVAKSRAGKVLAKGVQNLEPSAHQAAARKRTAAILLAEHQLV